MKHGLVTLALILIVKDTTTFQVLFIVSLGYWHRSANERHGKPPQGNQELLVVRDKVERPPGELGVSYGM